ncbi:hypothetical protein HD806DRAFT_306506 [Xylariaceae sp. AK1471]|nr:hypothetical protein HD806DRAFT_306506 [Xylariaceae sp. AK1471]
MGTETLLDITIRSLSSPEPENQRGRKRRRDLLEVSTGRPSIPSAESATFRGRCRCRSTSRYLDMSSLSRPTSQHRLFQANHRNTSASLSPSRRRMLRIIQLTGGRQRSQSPSRSQSPLTAYYKGLGMGQDAPKRRRQRTRSRSRTHRNVPVGLDVGAHGDNVKTTAVDAVMLPFTAYEIVMPSAVSTVAEENNEQG